MTEETKDLRTPNNETTTENTTELPEEAVRLAKIDEVAARTDLSFSQAKTRLEAYDYDLVDTLAAIDEEAQRAAADSRARRRHYYDLAKGFGKEKYGQAKDFSKEQYDKLKDFGQKSQNDLRKKLHTGQIKTEAKNLCGKVKDTAATPVKITKGGRTLPAGVLAAGLLPLLYPLHKSKALAALGAGAVGVWAVSKQLRNEELKTSLKNSMDHFSQNLADSLNGLTADRDCFVIPVDAHFQPQKPEKDPEQE